ncbi:hypothetical protein ALP8811_02354 [Aliiroseovarius pelagivivens]|uniref:Uncharacterized protein n=1 Tax=Aliiroseovarius pelagivivens TaxID=1639690 RepID=A0A2R8AN81_9RHOB|nr:hypothetical protein [Aliiroseovarius pelagivivens]SPF77327.1 hypothetical protein ALP8811_02354 [Aliiroseovarius pelagivivens]
MKSPIAVGAALIQFVLGGMLLQPALSMPFDKDALFLLFLPGLLFAASGVTLIVKAPRPGEYGKAWLCIFAFVVPYIVTLPMVPIMFHVIAR